MAMAPTIAAPKFNMPMQAPQQAPAMAPAPQVGMAVTESAPAAMAPMMPYGYPQQALSIREPSFLSGQDVQSALKENFMQTLKMGAADRQAARGEELATKIFGATIAPALAIFGGPGTSDAGVAMIKEASQKVKEGRAEQQNRELAAFKGIQSISDIVNTASVKPLTAAFKAQKDFEKATMQEQGKASRFAAGEQGKTERQGTRIEGQKSLETLRQEGRTSLEKLRGEHRQKLLTQTLGEKSKQFEQTRTDKMKIHEDMRQLRLLQEKNRLGIAEAQDKTRMTALANALKVSSAKMQYNVAEFNSELERSLSEKTKNGFKFQDENGQPLDPQQFMLEANQDLFDDDGTGSNWDAMRQEVEQILQAQPQQQMQQQQMQPAQGGQQSAAPVQSKAFSLAIKNGRDPGQLKQQVIQSLRNRGLSFAEAQAKVAGMK